MPEGPEIRREADRIARVLEGRRIHAVSFGLAALRRFEKRLCGAKVMHVETRGKAMLTRFDNDLTLYSHNQLYGRWYTTRRPTLPNTNRQLRAALHTATHSALLFSASDIAVLTDRQLAAHPFLNRIGPDVMDRSLTADQLRERMGQRAFRNRALGSLYLDQAFLAGNGNYLRSETLFIAGVHPTRRPAELSGQEIARLARESLRVPRRSYRTRGITLLPALDKTLREAGENRSLRRFYVFGRDGLPCRRCATAIERLSMSSRNIFLCRACQPLE